MIVKDIDIRTIDFVRKRKNHGPQFCLSAIFMEFQQQNVDVKYTCDTRACVKPPGILLRTIGTIRWRPDENLQKIFGESNLNSRHGYTPLNKTHSGPEKPTDEPFRSQVLHTRLILQLV